MNKNIRNGLLIVVAGILSVSCADYNEIDNFTAQPDPSYVLPYQDYAPIKSYIDKAQYPNMTIGATMKLTEFNKQALSHAAAVTHFDHVSLGTSMMSGSIIGKKGMMNFMDMKELLEHTEEIGFGVYGSPIAANANQAEDWYNLLTAPVEIMVMPIEDKFVDYTTMDAFTGTKLRGNPTIVKNYDSNGNALKVPKRAQVYIVEDFDIDPLGDYTVVFYAKVDKNESIICTFSGNKIMENAKDAKKYSIEPGSWKKITVEADPAEGVTNGYLMIEGNLNSDVYIRDVTVSHMPDNHRPQTEEEIKANMTYALSAWCDGLMSANAGRIKSFDLIDEALDAKAKLENGMFDLKHGDLFWQDIFGSENYAPTVSSMASSAFEKSGGNISELKFFISETGLEDPNRFESLKYWMGIWEANGAKIDGINAKLNLSYSEDAATQAANEATLTTLLDNLASSGKLIRLSNFDIKYQDAEGTNVAADKITDDQRQKLADFNAHVIKAYMNKIPHDKQAGLCKGNLADTSDPVGLWSVDKDSKDWVRTATFEAFCKALSGQ